MTEKENDGRTAMELALTLLQASAQERDTINNQLLEAISKESERQQAAILLIQQSLKDLLSGMYMPTSYAILRAAHPTAREVDEARKFYIKVGEIIPLLPLLNDDAPAS